LYFYFYVYGDAGHALEFHSTAPFYNHASGGVVPYLNNPISYQEYTVGLDSWLTLGQVAIRNQNRFCGVLKSTDGNGNSIAGSFNDGGMLANTDVSAGIPLTTADGMDTMRNIIGASSWGYNLPDSSIFGPLSDESDFISTSASIQCDGARGNDTSNLVLVAQLTTAGDISFRLNLRVSQVNGSDTTVVDYVSELAPGESPSSSLIPLSTLIYPPVCGCTDPDYLEYDIMYTCSIEDSCRNLVRFGCLDTAACNYDPSANFNLPTLCCYPGYCNDRNLEVVCPQLTLGRQLFSELAIVPNPFAEALTIIWQKSNGKTMMLEIYDSQGGKIRQYEFHADMMGGRVVIDVRDLASSLYLIRITDESDAVTNRMIKR
ncbi:MAG: T9SS type A sorting domain-containing protein, partial [Bacteroidota bacterium]